jgi:nicotinamidase-related amidase
MGNQRSVNLHPSETALVVIDVQRGIFSRPTPVFNADILLLNINSLKKQFADAGAAVFFIQHSNQKLLVAGSDNWLFHPELEISEYDIIIQKTHGNAFEGTNLKGELDAKGIRNIVITGLVTNGCVKATCIGGDELGYRVILVEDGHSSYVKGAAKLIRDWNRKLSEEFVDLYPISAISLG